MMQQYPAVNSAVGELRQLLSHASQGQYSSQFLVTSYAALQHLRDSGDPTFLFLRSLLELIREPSAQSTDGMRCGKNSSDTTELMFHCAIGVRDTLLMKWEMLPLSFLCVVRDFFLTCGLWGRSACSTCASVSTEALPPVVSKAFLSSSAAFWKRSWLTLRQGDQGNSTGATTDPSSLSMTSALLEIIQCQTISDYSRYFPLNETAYTLLFDYLEHVIVNPLQLHQNLSQPQQQLQDHNRIFLLQAASMACFFLSTLLGEVSGIANTSAADSSSTLTSASSKERSGGSAARYNQPLEFHRQVYKDYSSDKPHSGLDSTLKISMHALSLVVQIFASANVDTPRDGQLPRVRYNDVPMLTLATAITSLTIDAISWDFSIAGVGGNSSTFSGSAASNLLKPPQRWRSYIIQPDFLGGIFTVYSIIRGQILSSSTFTGYHARYGTSLFGSSAIHMSSSNGDQTLWQNQMGALAHSLRQLLLQLSSVSGAIFSSKEEQSAYAGFLVEGCLNVLTSILLYDDPNDDTSQQEWREGEAMDVCATVCRLILNFKLEVLSLLRSNQSMDSNPSNNNFLGENGMIHAMCTVGRQMCSQMLQMVESHHGDLEGYQEDVSWREEALDYILEGATLLVEDPWLQQPGNPAAIVVMTRLANALSPLYATYVNCRVKISRIEEHYQTANEADLDEVREDISAQDLEEQMAAAAIIGRTNIASSIECLSSMFQETLPRLRALLEAAGNGTNASGVITPEGAAILEEARLILVCVMHLLTDDTPGETPMIPEAIVRACQQDPSATQSLTSLVLSCMSLAEFQASRIAVAPSDPRLSPLLGTTLLRLLNRWAPAYIIPSPGDYSHVASETPGILSVWNSAESAQQAVSFCVTLCLHYYCFWPQEHQLQDHAVGLLQSLSRKGPGMRQLLVNSASWEQLVAVHIITAGMRHNSTDEDLDAAISEHGAVGTSIPKAMIKGYQRLPYSARANIFSTIIIGCSDDENAKAAAMLNVSLEAVHSLFTSFLVGLGNGTINSLDSRSREVAVLVVEMYGGIAQSSEMNNPDRIPQFLTPYLSDLSGLMLFFAEDLTICETLLRLFRDYAEQFIAMLNRAQCLALFQASADLLRSYSEQHCASRQVKRGLIEQDAFDEEQNFNDVLCAIQLLIHLGTKDFIDVCADVDGCDESQLLGVESGQITDVIFFGLQQIIPLMTQGLLQFPALCTQYFSLVGFMMDTYPEKACELPYDLFRSLLDSLLFGMSHSDPLVSKSSLTGIRGIAVEHLKTHALSETLAQHGDIFDQCIARLFEEVIFQTIVWDRLEASGLALMPLIAVDVNRFVTLVNVMAQKLASSEKQQRFLAAFEKLLRPEVISKVASGGYEGRMTRVQFKKDFEVFVKDVHSFMILR